MLYFYGWTISVVLAFCFGCWAGFVSQKENKHPPRPLILPEDQASFDKWNLLNKPKADVLYEQFLNRIVQEPENFYFKEASSGQSWAYIEVLFSATFLIKLNFPLIDLHLLSN